MAHNINSYIGRQAAWHGLGKVTGEYMTWKQILVAGGLDFSVFKSQLLDGRGRKVEAYGMFRWDKATDPGSQNTIFLGTVGKEYQPIHHSKGFETIDTLVASQDGAHYETAGALGQGEKVWGLADLKFGVKVGDDVQKGYLLFSTSHDGSMSHTYRTCLTRVVCQNTLNVALGEKSKAVFRIRHTKNAGQRITDAKVALGNIQTDMRSVEEKLNFLATRKVERANVEDLMAKLFPMKKEEKDGQTVSVETTRRTNIIAEILQNYEYCDGNAFPDQRGTAYNLLNAVTEYVDHQRSSNDRAESALFGSGDTLKTRALEYITESAQTMSAKPYVQSYLSGGPLPQNAARPSVLDAILAETN